MQADFRMLGYHFRHVADYFSCVGVGLSIGIIKCLQYAEKKEVGIITAVLITPYMCSACSVVPCKISLQGPVIPGKDAN